jgi:hypothetical protein
LKITSLALAVVWTPVAYKSSKPADYQASIMCSQLYIACHSSSSSLLHNGHNVWQDTCFSWRRKRVGKQPLAILHNKCLVFGGATDVQILCQSACWESFTTFPVAF